jgi:hypothetical protein
MATDQHTWYEFRTTTQIFSVGLLLCVLNDLSRPNIFIGAVGISETQDYKHKHISLMAAFILCWLYGLTNTRERETSCSAKYLFCPLSHLGEYWQHTAPARARCNTNNWCPFHSLTGWTRWIVIQDRGRGNSTSRERGVRGVTQIQHQPQDRCCTVKPLSLSLSLSRKTATQASGDVARLVLYTWLEQ